MKSSRLLTICLISLLIIPNNRVEAQETETNDSVTTIREETEFEGFNFNQSIQDVDNYFKTLGSDVVEGLEIIEQFDRDLESYYNEYEKLSDTNLSQNCLSVNFVTGECRVEDDDYTEELALMFLESQFGIDRETISFVGKIFNIVNGEIKTKNVKTVAGDLLGVDLKGKECPFILRTIAGSCDDDTRLPILVTRKQDETREQNKASGNYRTLSQPTHLLLNENLLNSGIEPNTNIQLANLYDREIARSVAYGFVEERGQKWLGDNLLENYLLADENTRIYQQIYKLTGESMNLSVTQDVMKVNNLLLERFSHLTLNQSIINTKNQASLMSIQQENAYSLQIQANISDTLDRDVRTRQNEQEATVFRSLVEPLYLPEFKYMYE